MLKPNWAAALPPRVDYTLYLETKKDKSVARRVRIGKIKASTLKKALHKVFLSSHLSALPPSPALLLRCASSARQLLRKPQRCSLARSLALVPRMGR